MDECDSSQALRRRMVRRLLLLVATLAVGSAVAAIGYHFSGNRMWVVAIPGVLSLVWLFVANPEECCGMAPRSDRDNQSPR